MMSTVLAPASAAIAQHLQLLGSPDPRYLTKLLVVAPAASVAAVAFLCGWIIDRVGGRRTLLAGLMLFALAGTTGLYLQTFAGLLVGRLALGLAGAAIKTSVLAVVAQRLAGHHRARFLGLQSAAMGLGALGFIILGSLLYPLSWHLPFLAYAAALPLLAWLWVNLQNSPTPPPAAHTSTSAPSVKFRTPTPPGPANTRTHNADDRPGPAGGFHRVWLPTLLGLLSMATFYIALTQTPFYLTDLGLAGPLIGVSLALFSLGAVAAGLAYGPLRRRLPVRATFGLLFFIWSLGYGLIAAAPALGPLTVAALLLGHAVAGLAGGLALPNCVAAVYDRAPSTRMGLALGVLTTALFAGECLSPLITQPLVTRLGEAAAFAAAAVLCLLLATLHLRQPSPTSHPPGSDLPQ